MPAKKTIKKERKQLQTALKNIVSRGKGFLPAGYELPKPTSSYLELEEGDTRIRILSAAEIGWEAWIDGVAHRAPGEDCPFNESEVDAGKFGPSLTHFWAFLVWNDTLKKIQIWQVKQRGILTGLWNLLQQEEWGDPRGYGIIVTKTVVKQKKEYKVVGVPPKPLSDQVKRALAETTLSLDKVFEEAPEEDAEPVAQTAKEDDF